MTKDPAPREHDYGFASHGSMESATSGNHTCGFGPDGMCEACKRMADQHSAPGGAR